MVVIGGVVTAIILSLVAVDALPDQPVTILERIAAVIYGFSCSAVVLGLILWFATTVLDSLNQL